MTSMNGSVFAELLKNGYKNLFAHYKAINDLNVFPVPDGDTGTNMKLTYSNGLKTITDDDASVGVIADEVARGMLFGARGNSGVLTSQYFRGFADEVKDLTELSVKDFAKAMVGAYKNAYKACADVAEGTILTVAREGIENVKVLDNDDFESFLSRVVMAMKISLDNTPNLLPVLKENGVIDSGGKGLLTIFEGYLYFFNGQEIKEGEEEPVEVKSSGDTAIDYSAFNENSKLEYGYCTEFLLQLLRSKIDIDSFDIDSFISWMMSHGESLVCFQTGTIVKVHIHTKKPYEVIKYAQKFGEFVSFKMENMALQHNEVISKAEFKAKERKPLAVIAIAQGDGIIDSFKEMNVDLVLNGGQTMNTSVSEMIDAFKFVNADEIILLPNETNIIKAAYQAAELYKDSKVRVVETHNIQEGYSALQALLGNYETGDECYDAVSSGVELIDSVTVFKSAKDAKIGKEKAPKGSYVSSFGHKLVGYKPELIEATLDALSKVENMSDREVMFLIYGQMVQEEVIEELLGDINYKYPLLEVGVVAGKQDVYDLLIGIYK